MQYCVLNRMTTQRRNNFMLDNKIRMPVGDSDDVGRMFPHPAETNPISTQRQHNPKGRSLAPTVFVFHTPRHTPYSIHPGANIPTAYEEPPHEGIGNPTCRLAYATL